MAIYYQPPPPFVGGFQPDAPHLGVSSELATERPPPFSHTGRWASQLPSIQAWIPPDPSPFVGAWQPLARRQLAPSISAVPVSNPPFAPDYNQQTYWNALVGWTPQPFQLPAVNKLVQTTSVSNSQPYNRLQDSAFPWLQQQQIAPQSTKYLVQPAYVATGPWSSDFSGDFGGDQPNVLYKWLPAAWTSWIPPSPLPILTKQLLQVTTPSNPPFGPDYGQPQTWTILAAWTPPPPAPWQRPPLQQQSVDNPSFGGYAPSQPEYLTVLSAWTPPPPAPWQEPETQIVSVDNPTPDGYGPQQTEYAIVLGTWVPPDPTPTQKRPLQTVSVDNPPYGPDYNQSQYWSVLTAWVPPDPVPWQKPATQRQSVDNPPIGGYVADQPEYLSIVGAWAPPDPAPWQKLPSQTVSVDNPPVRSGAWTIAMQAGWIPPDPSPFMGAWQPLAPRLLPAQLTAVAVNNPPFLTPPIEASVRASWEVVPPLPTLGVKALQPFVSPPVGQPVKLWTWLSTVLSDWTPPDPLPTLPRWLPAQFTAVRVDTPIGLTQWLQAVAPTADAAPMRQRLGVPVAPAVVLAQPYVLSWLTTVLTTWGPADPAQMPRRAGQIVSSDNPPLRSGNGQQAPPSAWQSLEPMPAQRRVAAPPSIAAIPLYSNAGAQATPWVWQPADPSPTLRKSSQTISIDRPPIQGAPLWLPGVLGEWKSPDPIQLVLPKQIIRTDNPPRYTTVWPQATPYAWQPLPPSPQTIPARQTINVAVNAAPLIYQSRIQTQRAISEMWEPLPPRNHYGTGLAFVLVPIPLGIPGSGRYVFLQPELRAALLSLDVRGALLSPDVRAIQLTSDARAVLYQPDIRAVLLQPESSGGPMDPVNIPEMFWTAAGPGDTDWYYMLLDIWLPAGDTVNTPTVTITSIVGDLTPPSVTGIAVELGAVTLTIAPGIPYVSNGPRIKCKISGGTVGNTYSTVVGWQDSQGRTLARTVLLPVEAR